ncbi:MAG: DUF3320 domain-containing protein [Chitinophagales bacterium]
MENTLQKTLEYAFLPVFNYALHQNQVPAFREISIRNTSENTWKSLALEISCDTGIVYPWKWSYPELHAGESASIDSIHLQFDGKQLAELTEKIIVNLRLELLQNGEKISEEMLQLNILAFDQWNGVVQLPEMLAAFITPNHPEIVHIIQRGAEILAKWTGSPSFDEYQTRNPDRVRKQIAALFEALREKQTVYCSVPASFEQTGQRVRLADAIFTHKLANCLDISLLFAACLEAVGIHPLIQLIKGHAFVGAWLVDDTFADPVNDDATLITKRMADGINEILVLEATTMNSGAKAVFDEAVKMAEMHFTDPDAFVLCIDVQRARYGGIRPLPLRVQTASGWEFVEEKIQQRNVDAPADLGPLIQVKQVDRIDLSKQQVWERKLLDLTLRNSLLNTRLTKSTLQFMTVDISKMEDALADGAEFEILPKPKDWEGNLRDAGLYTSLHLADPVSELIRSEMVYHRLRSYLTETELHSALVTIYRQAKISLDENGANTLFIGLGYLKWYETPVSEKPRFAPILLMPVEIIRKSAKRGYVIRGRDEETMINVTLLEMLRQDFHLTIGGLEDLPMDASGVNVKAVFNIIRQAVMSKKGWDVEEHAILATYSFNKFILWKDIHYNAHALLKNKIVKSLVSGKLEWQETESVEESAVDDAHLHPTDIALPIATDSSQLQAIQTSTIDTSFILHGPPGTGKSQTITNIIANALYKGKKVLFVSAKKAALEVVENRLKSIGLHPFCLELHSNKANKAAVLEQLAASGQIVKGSSQEQYVREADRLFDLRKELNEYVEALHKEYPFGYTLYGLFVAYSCLPEGETFVQINPAQWKAVDKNLLQTWRDTADEVQAVGTAIGHPHNHLLSAFRMTLYSSAIKEEIKDILSELRVAISALSDVSAELKNWTDFSGVVTRTEEDNFYNFLKMVSKLEDTPPGFMIMEMPDQTLRKVQEAADHGKKRNVFRSALLQRYRDPILQMDANAVELEWREAEQKWFLPKWLKQNSIKKQIKLHALDGSLINRELILPLLQEIQSFQQEEKCIQNAADVKEVIGYLWKNGEADWERIVRTCYYITEINRIVTVTRGQEFAREWRIQMKKHFADGSDAFVNMKRVRIEQYCANLDKVKALEDRLQEIAGVPFAELFNTEQNWTEVALEHIDNWSRGLDALKNWCNWIEVKQKCERIGLNPLIRAYESGLFATDRVVLQFQKGAYKSAAEFILELNPKLAIFNAALFEERIRRFRLLSEEFEQLTKKEVYARLAARVPSFTQEAAQGSEIGILQKAILSKGKRVAIRKLFDAIPNLLPRLKPCMLMSPISVAQYFDLEKTQFDLLVFDEASQLPTCESVGAIARAKNVIVVGDPKQMPPTNFFMKNSADEDNFINEDMESILDDCLALSMPSKHLLWHYRSKHESLIAFSNVKYYDGELLTFPSNDDLATKVHYVHVDGFYDKGRSRQNRSEAEAIVAEIVRRSKDVTLKHRSIGIVTFSSVQQNLVEDLLNEAYAKDASLERWAFESEEPLFIKNLENVQGDERDVILFSIGYGPDKDGNVSLNFGPINRDGGWRRLNVAVSRARYEMIVFSTLRSDQIDLNRTNSEGMAGLKAFLAYSEKGRNALPEVHREVEKNEFALADVIAEKLRTKGYEVHTHIGSSSFKLDIGIVSSADPRKYILGIRTDGKNYYKAKTSRDREIVQQQVLTMLGWRIYKVWAADWWDNSEQLLLRIEGAIKAAEEGLLQSQVEESYPDTTMPKLVENVQSERNEEEIAGISTEEVAKSELLNYIKCDLPTLQVVQTEELMWPANREIVKRQLQLVIDTEAPVSLDILYKRVLAAWKIGRLGSRLRGFLNSIAAEGQFVKSQHGDRVFYWRKDQTPDRYTDFRINGGLLGALDCSDIAPEEIANAAHYILRNQIGIYKDDLIRELAKIFGYARIGKQVEEMISIGISLAVEKGYAQIQDDRYIYSN